jgi:glyoxylase-like metal-dependent hydrolase (beta-lactamase superfamily II)
MTRQTVRSLGCAVLLAVVPAAAQAQQDFSKVEIVTTKISNNFMALDGQGGRIGVLFGADGIFMVDSQFAPLSDRLAAAMRQVSNAPIRVLVNTHVHGDHTGGNENFARMGAMIVARPLLKQRLEKPAPPAGGGTAAAVARGALPVYTPDTRTRMSMDGETIDLIPLPQAHTDGDTAVKFVKNDVLMTGDVFRSTGYPNIDRANGGSLAGIFAAFDTLIASAGPKTKVLPGHGPITNRAAIVAHKRTAIIVRDRVAAQITQGKTLEQIVASKPTKDFDERTGSAATSADRFVGQVYAELTAAK